MFLDESAEDKFKFAQKVIGEVRSAKAKYDVPYKTKIECKYLNYDIQLCFYYLY